MVCGHSSFIWYLDSGASTHITDNPNNLITSEIYSSYTSIATANGENMRIFHTGKSRFTKHLQIFELNDLLHVPSATKNLLLVYQFCVDNHVYLEFDCQSVRVRDADTNEILLEVV